MPGNLSLGADTSVPTSFASLLAAAHTIEDITHIPYPEDVIGSEGVLNSSAKGGKFV
jgi:hypothetical protein